MLIAALVAWRMAAPAAEPNVEWDAPSACPSEAQVRSWTVELLRTIGPDAVPVSAQGRVRATSAGGFELELSIDSPRGRHVRILRDEQCETLARAGAVVIAVAADAVAVADAIAAPAAEEAIAVPLPPAPIETAERSVEEPPVEPPRDVAPRSPVARRGSSHRFRAGLRVQGTAGWGILPRGDFGFGVAAAAIHRLARIELVLSHVVRSPARYATFPDAGADLRVFSALVRGCGVPSRGAFELPLCGGVEAGAVTGQGFGVSVSRGAIAPWAAVTGGAALAWRATEAVALWVEAGGHVALTRPGFFLQGPDEELYRVRAGGVRGTLGIEVRIP